MNGAGDSALPNGQFGIAVYAPLNTLGSPGHGNTVSGNASGGILVYGEATTGTVIQGNRIGTDVTTGSLIPNVGHGVYIVAPGTRVGGSGVTEGNVIAGNALNGVYIVGATSLANTVRGNSIYDNAGWGIDLAPYSPTSNDADDADTGPNGLQNYPDMASATLNGVALTITYSVASVAPHSAYPLTVDFYLADAAGQEGQTYLGSDAYTASGLKSVSVPAGATVGGAKVVATATDADGNTSEFSLSVEVSLPLAANGGPVGPTTLPAMLSDPELHRIVQAAWSRWAIAGIGDPQRTILATASYNVADLPGSYLGLTSENSITIDRDAAGFGWFVDPTPGQDEEFDFLDSDHGVAAIGDAAVRMDLSHAVMHEMGHLLGLQDGGIDRLMSELLDLGTRRLPM